MPGRPLDPRQLGHYYALAQVGLEMVAPLAVGLALDYCLGWAPWGAIGGAILGLIGGVAHLAVLANRPPDRDGAPSEQDKP